MKGRGVMEIFKISMLCVGGVFLLIMLISFLKSKKFLKNLISSAILGVGSLTALSIAAPVTGLTLCLTPYTIAFAAIFGLPGTVALSLIKIIWGI
jgi:hypothetical protein